MEKIINIIEVEQTNSTTEIGFDVVTNNQTIELRISDDPQCGEAYGYFMSEDDIMEFIGAEVISVTAVPTKYDNITPAMLDKLTIEVYDNDNDNEENVYEGDIMFVNIETSKGLLQFTAYNDHNGYYGHTASVRSTQQTTKTKI